MFKNWVEGLSDEAYWLPLEVTNEIGLKLANHPFATKQLNVSIHPLKVTCEFFKIIENKQKCILFFIVFHC